VDKISAKLAILAFLAALFFSDRLAADSERNFVYQAYMSPYGNIGTYRSGIKTSGGEKTITTDAQIKVSLAGIVLYSLNVSRIERQIGDRIVYFHGITTENGKPKLIEGKAVGENFVISTPSGSVTAPGTIRTSDPWSAGVSGAKIVFMPDTGAVVGVRTSGGERIALATGNGSIWVSHYQIDTVDGSEKYELWLDEQRTPIKFSIADQDGTTMFTLVR
jgi:hypothetical protein